MRCNRFRPACICCLPARNDRPIKLNTLVDPLIDIALTYHLGHASHLICRHGGDKGRMEVTATALRSRLAETNSDLLMVSNVKGPHFFSIRAEKRPLAW